MKATIFVAVLAAVSASAAGAATISALYDTGVDNSGIPLVAVNSTSNVADPHFTTNAGTAAFTFYLASYYSETLTASARWISTAVPSGQPPGGPVFATAFGNYNYTETFDLTGLIPSTLDITGMWASDDCATIFINGMATNQTIGGGISSCTAVLSNFTTLSTFQVNSTTNPAIIALLGAGTNTIDFEVHNSSSNTALLVTGLQGTASSPEPASVLLTLTGILMLVIGKIRRHA